jgi:hypothetical protein
VRLLGLSPSAIFYFFFAITKQATSNNIVGTAYKETINNLSIISITP